MGPCCYTMRRLLKSSNAPLVTELANESKAAVKPAQPVRLGHIGYTRNNWLAGHLPGCRLCSIVMLPT